MIFPKSMRMKLDLGTAILNLWIDSVARLVQFFMGYDNFDCTITSELG